ncbi:MAG: OsmC family protein [Chloroflexota bacterium]
MRDGTMATLHNVRVDNARATAEKAKADPSAAQLSVDLVGDWRTDETKAQFGGTVKYARGETTFEADFPAFLSGDGRAPSPLIYCFWGALSCYASTYAMQAAMVGMKIKSLRARLRLQVDFRPALGVAEVPPLNAFAFELDVATDASEDEVARVKRLADERCPAIWAMDNRVAHTTEVRRT